MAYNVTSLQDYVNENKKELISKSVFGNDTVKYVNTELGIKFKSAIHLLETDPVLQARTCGFDASGNVTYSNAYIEVAPIKVNMELCDEDLRTKWMQDELKTAAGQEVLPFEQRVSNEIADSIARKNEKLIWQGDTSNGDLVDGFLTRILDSSVAIDASSAATTVYGKIKDVYNNIPVEILDKAEIFVGIDDFRTLQQELVTANLYHFQPTEAQALEFVLPGSNTKIHAVSGLNAQHAIVAANPAYLYVGMDMANDAEEFDIWYSREAQTHKVVVKYNLGTQIIFPDLIVYDK